MGFEEGICKLCLEKCESFKAIDENTKDVIDMLLPKIDFTIIQEPVMCKHCEEMLIQCFEFKTTCLRTHDHIVPFVNKKDDVKLNLKDVHLNIGVPGTDVPEDQDVCVCCMGLVKKCSTLSLDVEEGDVMLKIMLEQCLPELDLSVIKKPVICATCRGYLQNCFHFVTNCLNVEEKIKKYRETLDIDSKSQIELSSLLQFTLSDLATSEGSSNSVDIIKVEEQFCEYRDNPDEVETGNGSKVIKLEQMPFDDSEDASENVENKNGSYQKVKITSQNVLTCEEESDNIVSIKKEEIFCEDDENKEKEENSIEMEDQKFLLEEEIEIKTEEPDFSRFEDGIVFPHPKVATGLRESPKCLMSNHKEGPSDSYIKQTLTNENGSIITVYRCERCSFQTRNKYYLKGHLLRHKGPSNITMYRCNSCSFQSRYNRDLKNHLLVHKDPSEVTIYKCDSCSFQTKLKGSLRTHSKVHREVPMYKCDHCSYQTKREFFLEMHALKHKNPSEVTVYKCDHCSYQTKCEATLKMHLIKHKSLSEVTTYKCDHCSHQTKCKDSLKMHLLKHKNPSEVTIYKCDSCSFQTKFKGSLRIHGKVHREIPMYKCDHCSYQTKREFFLEMHVLKHKNPSEVTMYKCEHCSFQTKRKDCLKMHSLKHKDPSQVTIYKCHSCSFQTRLKRSLRTHLNRNIHQGVTIYNCGYCLYQTKREGFLKRHMLKHLYPLEVAMYKCDHCSYQTKRKRNLRMHLVKHKDPSEITIYKCNSCSFQTKLKGSLRAHMLNDNVHRKVPMYKCDNCSYQSKHKFCLLKHCEIVHQISEITVH